MLEGPLAAGILLYTIPIILTSLLQLLFNAADLIVVGRYCGSVSVAAVGSTSAITNLMVNLFIGLSVGAGVAVAHSIGSREPEVVHRTVHTAMPVAIVSGLIITAMGLFLTEPVLRWMSTPEDVLPLAVTYMRLYFLGMVFNMVYNFSAAILRAAGDTRSPLTILTIAGVINVILNVFFVTALDMNVAGVAAATVLSQAFSGVAVVFVLMRREDACKFAPAKMRFYGPQLKKIIHIGLPAGVQGSMFSISNVIIQSSINSFGALMVSGNAAVANLEGFEYAFVNAFHQSALNYVGQNVGAHQFDRVRRILRICLGYTIVVSLGICSLFYCFAPQLLSLYIMDSPEAIAIAIHRLAFTTLPYFLLGLLDVTTGALRGLGASFSSMVISLLGICGLRLVWIFTVFRIPQFHTPALLYVTYPISWIVTLAAQLIAFVIVFRRMTRPSE